MSQYDRIREAIKSGEAAQRRINKRLEQQRQNAKASRPRRTCPACGHAKDIVPGKRWCDGCLNKAAWAKNWSKD